MATKLVLGKTGLLHLAEGAYRDWPALALEWRQEAAGLGPALQERGLQHDARRLVPRVPEDSEGREEERQGKGPFRAQGQGEEGERQRQGHFQGRRWYGGNYNFL